MVSTTTKKLPTVPNTVDIVIHGETHTAASVIVERLEATPSCDYVAYKVEHPKDDFASLRIKAANNSDPVDLLKGALQAIVADIDDLIVQTKRYYG